MASLADVAQAAGVSPATASRVLNGQGPLHRIATATVTRVERAAAKLGYQPSYHARALRTQRSGTIGVVLNSGTLLGVSQAWTATILGGLDAEVRGAGGNVLLIGDRQKLAVLEDAWISLDQGRVDALVVFDYVLARYHRRVGRIPIPDDAGSAVVIIGEAGGTGHARVTLDAGPGLAQAIVDLASRGHRRFAWLVPAGEELRSVQVATAVAACGGSLRRLDLPTGALDVVTVHAAALDIGLPGDATAILCWNDIVALGVIAALRERGCRVPQDAAVVGVDDLHAVFAVPPLSTVAMPLAELGRCAAERALAMASDPAAIAAARGTCLTLPGRWVPRATT